MNKPRRRYQETLEHVMWLRFFLDKLQIIGFSESFFDGNKYVEVLNGKAIDKADSNAKRNIKSP